jgi:DNA primase
MEFVEQLKSQVDIVKTIGEYVRLKRLGSTGRYVGLCPFHQEKTPSFSVNQSRQMYHCFGCGVGGDVLKFVMEIDGLTFFEALKLLAERHGIPMPRRAGFSDEQSKLRGALYDIHTIAANLFQASLRAPQGAEARAYLAKRGVSPELIETFGLGFAEPSGQALLRRLAQEPFSPVELDASGLLRKRDDGSRYDSFRGRLMFPIHDESGKVIAFGGRAMKEPEPGGDAQPKYLNSPETPIYRKTSVLYNLNRARNGMRSSGRAVLVEGYMDVIGVYAAGVKEVVASCGTAFTEPQARKLHLHSDTVVVNFDPDTAGANATEKVIQMLLDEGLHVRVLALDGGLDPDEYVKHNGAEAYRQRLDSAAGYFHWLADRARARFDVRTAEGRMDAFKKVLMPAVEKLSDKLERAAVAGDLADYLGVDRGLVLDQFKRAAADRRPPAPAAAPAPAPVPPLERVLLNALLASRQAREEILPRLSSDWIQDFVARDIFEALRTMFTAGAGSDPDSDPESALDTGGAITFRALEERLAPPSQGLLRQIASADELLNGDVALEQARNCLHRMETGHRKRYLAALKAKVTAAERNGQADQARSLALELMRAESAARETTSAENAAAENGGDPGGRFSGNPP